MRKVEKFLTDTATPIADKLAARHGSIKNVLSAGIIALELLTPAERERVFAIANGLESIPEKPDNKLTPEVEQKIVELIEKVIKSEKSKRR